MRDQIESAMQSILNFADAPLKLIGMAGQLIKWCAFFIMIAFGLLLLIQYPKHALIALGFIFGFKLLAMMAGPRERDDDPTFAQRNTSTSIDSERRS